MTSAATGVDPAMMLAAFEARCRAATKVLYQRSGIERESQLAATGQADTVPSAETLTYFHSRVLPAASLRSLAASVVRAGVAVDVTTVSIAIVLMLRYCDNHAHPVSAHMMHRLFVACMLGAAKAHQDKFPCNKLLGKAVGISLAEMNRLECALTTALDWKFIVTQKDLAEAMRVLVPAAPKCAVHVPSLGSASTSEMFLADTNEASSSLRRSYSQSAGSMRMA